MITDKYAQKEYIIDLCNSVMALIVRRTKRVNYPNEDFKKVQNVKKHFISFEHTNITDEMFNKTCDSLTEISNKYPINK